MWYEIFKFELKYRSKRPETYLFFIILLLFSTVGVDFIFQGVELGLTKKNAPLVIAKTMAAITGIFMILASMIMGVPILRDVEFGTESLLFSKPITKWEYLAGRFLGSFTVLLFIFSGLLLGLVLGAHMPWHKETELLPFNVVSYVQVFVVVVLPILFFGASIFFVSGMLTKKLMVVYTQGIVLFVMFLLTKAITNEYAQGLLDPFSLTTLTQYTKDWTTAQHNTLGIGLNGILLHNKFLWMLLGLLTLFFGYHRFDSQTLIKRQRAFHKKGIALNEGSTERKIELPLVTVKADTKAIGIQILHLTKFYAHSLMKEASFWAIVVCGAVIIAINSVNLGTVFDVDSYPATHFIIAELQEMSLYFFIIILLFYSGELVWKERGIKQHLLNDSTQVHNLSVLTSKFLALNGIYVVLLFGLLLAGIIFQLANGYYKLALDVYFVGFFIEILPFLILYTFIAFFCQAVAKNKFVGILLTLIFFIANTGSEFLGFNHSLYKFGGKPLGTYSEMNGYGHFLEPYLWIKGYWMVFGVFLLIVSALVLERGASISLWHRVKNAKYAMTGPIRFMSVLALLVFAGLGGYIFYNTNFLNPYWTESEKQTFRSNYEKTLKSLEYFPQPKITNVRLHIELYPERRAYELKGTYLLKNTTDDTIKEIHVQKRLASHLELTDVKFEGGATANTEYSDFEYTVHELNRSLHPGDSISMDFKQTFIPIGFEDDNSNVEIVKNGTFFSNSQFPTLGYNSNYELEDLDERKLQGLPPRQRKANIGNFNELVNARSGSDSDGIFLDVTIGTSNNQTAITAGELVGKWSKNNRNYFHYRSNEPIINFYSFVSAAYEIKSDVWLASGNLGNPVALEIYHHPGHDYNVDRMFKAMKASLDYFSKNFAPYQYPQLRIMEFPRYAEFAQSFPNTIPFSEALGFVLDIDDTTDVDMAFYITAHEVAHQWFGMQIEAANVKGRNFVLETLAQYGALMVLKANFSNEKVTQFLDLQKETYEKIRKRAISEPSLALVENEDFVYYNKGVIAMHKLQALVGEERVNFALQRFISDWDSYKGTLRLETGRYPTSQDLLHYFRGVAPKELHPQITSLFETNTGIRLNETDIN